ncbi:Protein tyrosine phosphatase type IVA 1 [Fukomys damarensis]|uniref:protein-tyrosine-phosphatase n=2 Tax=Fukomys damarensis TaxID=885580 RepID=A0A091D6Q7_FUKDA|nr:Protein tyrosine phosphatase type IVA 1 [Fukomys damarensis]
MNCPAPVKVTYKSVRFLITHNPTNENLNKFIEELKKYGVSTIVRVCEAMYDTTLVEKGGIHVFDWPFDDGAPPSNQIDDDWLNLVKIKFCKEPGCCIAVHCVAGFGRAPVLVALALIEGGMKYKHAVHFIRQKRHGAFNSKQLLYLEKYHPKIQRHFKDSNGHRNNITCHNTGVPGVTAWDVQLKARPHCHKDKPVFWLCE